MQVQKRDVPSYPQAVDGIFHVVRAFENDEVTHVDDSVDPVRDLETIQHELCQKDLEFVEKAVAAEAKAVRGTPGVCCDLIGMRVWRSRRMVVYLPQEMA